MNGSINSDTYKRDPSYLSRWGLVVYGNIHLSVFITDSKKMMVFPDPDLLKGKVYFDLRGNDPRVSDFLTFVDLDHPMFVEEGSELQIWYGEDYKGWNEVNNEGTHCVDVYAKISDRF